MNDAGITVYRYSERPELWEHSDAIVREVWPEYNIHSHDPENHWGRLPDAFPDFQFAVCEDEQILAMGRTMPYPWDGTDEGLGPGIDHALGAALEAADAGRDATALCALAAEIRPQFQGRGLANRMLDIMADLARHAGFPHLIAPVRPSQKERYPLAPIERYITWTNANGEPFDPWIRVHTRRGAVIVRAIPRSMFITGTVAEWEQWTGMAFPDDGAYTFPAGLATVDIDRARDRGDYWEPNVWIIHTLS